MPPAGVLPEAFIQIAATKKLVVSRTRTYQPEGEQNRSITHHDVTTKIVRTQQLYSFRTNPTSVLLTRTSGMKLSD
jgi:hypothetical protein